MGDAAGDGSSNVPITFDNEMWAKLNKIIGLGTANDEVLNNISKQKVAYCIGQRIFIKDGIDVSSVEIIDDNGKSILSIGDDHQINVSHFIKGIYYVRVKNKKGTYFLNKVYVH
jgi:hypothetical protein